MSYISPFAPKRKSLFASLFGAGEELFPFELQSGLNAPDVPEFANGAWQRMLDDGRADDFVTNIVNKYLPADGDDDDVDEKAASNGVVVESDSNHNNNNKSSSSSQSTRFKRKPAAATPAAEQELDTAHHVIRICGADNAKLLQEHGISQLSQLRGSPVAVLRDIVGDAEDVDLWPQMAALLADGHVWFDVERLRASRHVRARSPPTRLAPHHSSQDDVQAAPPVTPTASSRGKRANPTSSSKGDSVRNSSAKRSHAAAHVTPSPAPKSARRVTRSATKK